MNNDRIEMCEAFDTSAITVTPDSPLPQKIQMESSNECNHGQNCFCIGATFAYTGLGSAVAGLGIITYWGCTSCCTAYTASVACQTCRINALYAAGGFGGGFALFVTTGLIMMACGYCKCCPFYDPTLS